MGCDTYPKDSQQDERDEFDEVPRVVILHVEHHQVVVPERIEGTENEGRGKGTEERPPEGLQREVVAHLDTQVTTIVTHLDQQ